MLGLSRIVKELFQVIHRRDGDCGKYIATALYDYLTEPKAYCPPEGGG